MSAIENTAIILAAGQGKRMGSELPKVLAEVHDRPMIEYVLRESQAICHEQIVVIGHKGEMVREKLSDRSGVCFALQPEQLGTGHAVECAMPLVSEKAASILVLYGDTPLITTQTLQGLIDIHEQEENDVTVLAANVPNPTGYGRIIVDEKNELIGIVEEKDATDAEKKITCVNSGMYIFQKEFLERVLPKIENRNAQKERYLTDAISIGYNTGKKVGMYILSDWTEIIGVNTKEELEAAGKYLAKR